MRLVRPNVFLREKIMKSKLGEDEKVVRIVKHHLNEAFKNKYFKRGYRYADEGRSRSDNPYTLTEEFWEILRKRTYFDLGWEQRAFSQLPSDIKRKEKQRIKDAKERKKQDVKDAKSRGRWERKAKRRRERKAKRKKHKRHHS